MSLTSDIDLLIQQEKRLRFKSFNEADAWALGSKMRAVAEARALPLVMDIRFKGRPLFYAALPGTDADNPEWVRRKSNTTLRYLKCSYRFGRELQLRGQTVGPERGVDAMDYATAGGSFPIHIEGTGVIGAATVSGVPQRDDHNFVYEMICDFLGVDPMLLMLPPEAEA
jgi:uncharacterized protein (UPF0303 family)